MAVIVVASVEIVVVKAMVVAVKVRESQVVMVGTERQTITNSSKA